MPSHFNWSLTLRHSTHTHTHTHTHSLLQSWVQTSVLSNRQKEFSLTLTLPSAAGVDGVAAGVGVAAGGVDVEA